MPTTADNPRKVWRAGSWWFAVLWLFVILVSVFDGYLSFRHRAVLEGMELNPVGRTLIHWNEGSVNYLLLAKFVGTIAAAASVLLLWQARPSWGLTVISVLAALQLALLVFLLCA
jgi:hypothetical protein